MTLRGKILAVVIAVFVVLTGVLFFISRTVLLDGYKALEQQDMKQHITRVRLGIGYWHFSDSDGYDRGILCSIYSAYHAFRSESLVSCSSVSHCVDCASA